MSFKGSELLNDLEALAEKENPKIDEEKNEESLDYLNAQNMYHFQLLSSINSNIAKDVSLSQNEKCPFHHTKKHVLFGRAFLYVVSVLKKEMKKHFCEVLRTHGEEYLLPLRL